MDSDEDDYLSLLQGDSSSSFKVMSLMVRRARFRFPVWFHPFWQHSFYYCPLSLDTAYWSYHLRCQTWARFCDCSKGTSDTIPTILDQGFPSDSWDPWKFWSSVPSGLPETVTKIWPKIPWHQYSIKVAGVSITTLDIWGISPPVVHSSIKKPPYIYCVLHTYSLVFTE